MEKLRIGMFAWESLYSVKFGGIAPHVSELSEALAAKGHEVHIFTRSGGDMIYVRARTYVGNVDMRNRLTLIGDDTGTAATNVYMDIEEY